MNKGIHMGNLKRKGLALGLAVFTALTTLWVPELGGIGKVQAAESDEFMNSGEPIVQAFVADTGRDYYSLDSIDLTVGKSSTDAIYLESIYVYRNLNAQSVDYLPGSKRSRVSTTSATLYDSSDERLALEFSGLTIYNSTTPVYLMPGENYAVEVTLSTDTDEEFTIRAKGDGAVSSVQDGTLDVMSVVLGAQYGSPDDIILSGTDTPEIMEINETLDVSDRFSINPTASNSASDLYRPLTYASVNPSVATVDSETGVVTAVASGETTITASFGNQTATLPLHVVEVAFTDNTTITYNGTDNPSQRKAVTVNGMGTSYTVSYLDSNTSDSPRAAGEVIVDVRGTGDFITYQKELTYDIEPYDIAGLATPTIEVSADGTATITGFVGVGTDTSLQQGVDYSVSTTKTAQTATTATYEVTIYGMNNYTGSMVEEKTVTYSGSSSSSVNVRDIFQFSLKQVAFPYTGARITPDYTYINVDVINPDGSTTALTDDEVKALFTSDSGTGRVNTLNLTYAENVSNSGTVTVAGNSNAGYTGSYSMSFGITANDIADNYTTSTASPKAGDIYLTVAGNTLNSVDSSYGSYATATLGNAYLHTGSEIIPEVTLEMYQFTQGATNTTYTLQEGVDYEIYTDSSVGAIGQRTLTIYGINNFSGTWEITYTVVGDFAKDLSITTISTTGNSTVSNTGTADAPEYVTAYHASYTGNEVKPLFTAQGGTAATFQVRMGRTLLREGTHFQVTSYENNVDAGTATITLTGLGDYASSKTFVNGTQGTATVKFTIDRAALPSSARVVVNTNQAYTYLGPSKGVTPVDAEVVVYPNGSGTAFDVTNAKQAYTYSVNNNENAGTATITVTMASTSNYYGTVTGTYSIQALNLQKPQTTNGEIVVDYVDTWSVTGSAIQPEVTVHHKYTDISGNPVDVILNSSDYTVSYSNNTAVTSNATITITGNGTNLVGSIQKKFSITKKDFSDLSITLGGVNAVYSGLVGEVQDYVSTYAAEYTGARQTPSYTIRKNGVLLEKDVDYTISWGNVTNVTLDANGSPMAAARLRINGMGDYEGSSAQVRFQINPQTISASWVSSDGSFDASTNKPEVVVSRSKAGTTITLVEDKDYTITPETGSTWPKEAGKYTGIITGTGNYTGSTEFEYSIGQDLSTAKVTVTNPWLGTQYTSSVPYLGDYVPSVLVTINGETVDASNYTVSYETTQGGTTYTYSTGNTADLDRFISAGTQVRVIVTADTSKGTLYGEVAGEYSVTPISIGTGTLTFVESQIGSANYSILAQDSESLVKDGMQYYYNGERIEPNLTLTYYPGGTGESAPKITMQPSVDYNFVVNSANPVNVGDTYTISFTRGTGSNFTVSTMTQNNYNYAILPLPLYLADVYSGSTLIASAPYSAGSSETTKIADATASYVVQYEHQAATIEDLRLVYNGQEIPSTAYLTPSYTDHEKAGTATVTLTAKSDTVESKSNYSGVLQVKYTISSLNLTTDSIGDVDNYTYDGNAYTPTPVVSYGGTALQIGRDYTISYRNAAGEAVEKPTVPGTYYVVITPAGNYSSTGVVEKAFHIIGNIANTSLFTKNEVFGQENSTQVTVQIAMNLDSNGVLTSKELESKIANYTITRNKLDSLSGDTDTALSSSDYKVTYTLPNKPGLMTLVVAGAGENYTGSVSYTVQMTGLLSEATVLFGSSIYAYTGNVVRPDDITVQYNGQNLVSGTDYVISYLSTDPAVGTKQIRLMPGTNGLYSGSKEAEYSVKYNLSNATITDAANLTYSYTGSAVRPELTVLVGNKILEKDRDYTVSYTNNINVGTATATVKAVAGGNAYSEKDWNFNINPIPLNDATVTWTYNGETFASTDDLAKASFTYTGKAIWPVPTVTVNDGTGTKTLTADKDYKVVYGDNVNAGTGTVTIQGTTQYTGNIRARFKINQKNLAEGVEDNSIQYLLGDVYYAGASQIPVPDVEISYDATTLVKGTDFTIKTAPTSGTTYANDLKATVTITGNGNFTGSISKDIEVLPRDLNVDGAIIIENNQVTYTGSVINPQISVKVDLNDGQDAILTQGVDYTMSIQDQYGNVVTDNMVDVNTYRLTINALNSKYYTNSKYTDFTILPKSIATKEDGTTDISIAEIPGQDYTGAEVTPEPVVTDKTRNVVLEKDKDYTLSYLNNVNAASTADTVKPTVVVTGIGNYEGTREVYFNIGTALSSLDPNIIVSTEEFVYNGAEQTPSSVRAEYKDENGKTLTLTEMTEQNPNGNFTVTFDEESVHVGDKKVTITGTNGYYGSVTSYTAYKIRPKQATKLRIVPDLDYDETGKVYYTIYDGTPATPGVAIYDDEISTTEPLAATGDYDAYDITSYENNTAVGKALIKVTMKGDYAETATDTTTAEFYIRGKDVESFHATLGNAENAIREDDLISTGAYYHYTREVIKPEILFTYGTSAVSLTEGEDYTVVYTNSDDFGYPTYVEAEDGTIHLDETEPEKAGQYIAVVTGMGNYSGTYYLPYVIYERLENAEVEIGTQFFAGLGISPEPAITVEAGGNVLTQNTEENPEGEFYSTETSSDNYQSSGTVIITSASPYYTGSQTVIYAISTDGSYLESDVDGMVYTYDGQPHGKDLQITLPNGTIIYDGEYPDSYPGVTVVFSEVDPEGNEITDESRIGVDAGTVTATLTGLTSSGLTDLGKTVTYKILQKNITAAYNSGDLTVQIPNSRIYSGEKITVKPVLRFNNEMLKEGTDYTVEITDNVDPGRAHVTISGIGNFYNTEENPVSLGFTIKPAPVYGLDAEPTSASSIKLNWNYGYNVTGYEVGRVASDGVTVTNIVATTGNTYEVKGLSSGVTYEFAVRSYVIGSDGKVAAQKGDWNHVSAMTDISAPNAGDVSADSITNRDATFTWSTNANVDGYAIYRSTTANGTYSLVACVPLAQAGYADTMVRSGQTYYYKVRGYRAAEDGTWIYGTYSSPIQVTIK